MTLVYRADKLWKGFPGVYPNKMKASSKNNFDSK